MLVMSELLNKSSLDSISIWLFGQRIFCSVYVLHYGCISPLRFSEIRCKITSKYFLPLEIGAKCSTLPFYHVGVTPAGYVYQKIDILMILHMNFWWFHTNILIIFMIPHPNFGEWPRKFSIRFNCDFIGLKQTISMWAWWNRGHPYLKWLLLMSKFSFISICLFQLHRKSSTQFVLVRCWGIVGIVGIPTYHLWYHLLYDLRVHVLPIQALMTFSVELTKVTFA